jgi:ABC-type Fe3+/spermidine/putrescine transport system ATPase subunit
VAGLPPQKRDLGMVFQSYAVFPHLTVFDNIAFPLQVRRARRADIRQRVGEALELVRLQGYDRRLPRQLSGGEQQRVALARALVFRPRVLLMDEPLGALDKKLRESMQVELRALQRSLGITTIFVTHDQEEALTLSDRIAVMSEGRIEQLDTPLELYERPRNRFVSEFIGASNFLEGERAGGVGDLVALRTARGLTVWLPAAGLAAMPLGRVTVSVRPEKITLSPETPATGRNVFPATVESVVYLGTSTHYYVVTEEAERLIVYEQNVGVHGARMIYAAGDRVHVSWRPGSTLPVIDE